MEKKYFTLGASENSRIVKVIQVVFGLVCIVVAVFWLIFNFKIVRNDITIWITILFLTGFGIYEIMAGFGKATRFIEIDTAEISIKRNPLLPAKKLHADDLEKIELLPLNVVFYLKTNRRILLRFGTTYHETNEKIVEKIISFAETNNISIEAIDEKL